jgi:uncharacterized protein (DUF3084 family)
LRLITEAVSSTSKFLLESEQELKKVRQELKKVRQELKKARLETTITLKQLKKAWGGIEVDRKDTLSYLRKYLTERNVSARV